MSEYDPIRANNRLHQIKKKINRYRQWNTIGCPVYRDQIIELMARLTQLLDPDDYWQQMVNSGTAQEQTKFTNVITKATALRDWIYNNFPKQGSIWLVYEYGLDGQPIRQQLTAGQLSALLTYINDLWGG